MAEATRTVESRAALESLTREVEAARALLQAQQELEGAIRQGRDAGELLLRVRRQQETARQAAAAALERRRWIDGPGGLEAWLESHPTADAAALRRQAAEASILRGELLRTLRRGQYVVRRCLEWSQAQMAVLVEFVSRDGSTYSGPSSRPSAARTPSLLDHTV